MASGGDDECDVIVYGAGPVGAAVALGLQQRGHRVNMREKRSEQQVVGDAGKSINLSLSTRGRALLTELGVYASLEPFLVPMVCRRFPDGAFEAYREPLQSINRNVLTIKLIEAAQAAGVRLDYEQGFDRADFDAATGEVRLPGGAPGAGDAPPGGKGAGGAEDRVVKPRIVVGCDGVHGKVAKLVNPGEAERSSRGSAWGYYELNLPAAATAAMPTADFEHFHIWSGKGAFRSEFIVGLPNADRSITLTLFAPMDDMVGRYEDDGDDDDHSRGSAEGAAVAAGAAGAGSGAAKLRAYLDEAYDGDLGARVDGLSEAVAGGFQRIWLNDHACLAGEVGDAAHPGTFVFLFGDAALGMEQFLGLAVNLGFEGVHRFLEHYETQTPGGGGGGGGSGGAGSSGGGGGGRRGCERDVEFFRGQARARNALNAGAKALQRASTKNAASMRDGCDDPLGKAVRAAVEAAHGKPNIDESAFESTHDWWSFCEIPLAVCERIVADQDAVVADIKQAILDSRGAAAAAAAADAANAAEDADGSSGGSLSEAEKQAVLDIAAPRVAPLMAQRARLLEQHHAMVAQCFEQ